MTLPEYAFDGFLLRPPLQEDLPLAAAWNEAEPTHDGTNALFYTWNSTEVNSFVLCDEQGPIFFIRMQTTPPKWDPEGKWLGIYILFSPGGALRQRRTRHGLRCGMRWLEKMLTETGFEGYYFHSLNPQLVYFTQHVLGFEWDGQKVFKKIARDDGSR